MVGKAVSEPMSENNSIEYLLHFRSSIVSDDQRYQECDQFHGLKFRRSNDDFRAVFIHAFAVTLEGQ